MSLAAIRPLAIVNITRSNPDTMANRQRNKEQNVSETATDTEPTEASTEEAATAPATEATAPAEPKVDIDHAGNLFDAIVAFAAEQDNAKLQEAYRAVPAAARGKVQGVAMKRAMTEGNVDMEVLGNVLDAFNSLPAATKSTRTKVDLDPVTAGALRLAGLMVGFAEVEASLGDTAEQSRALATEWFNSTTPEAHQSTVLKVAAAAVAASNKGGGKGGAGGPRNSFKQTLAQLVEAGTVPAGTVLKGSNDAEATVNADGTVTSDGTSYENLSKAARAHRKNKEGKETSTNGWDFWQIDGKPVGNLRTF